MKKVLTVVFCWFALSLSGQVVTEDFEGFNIGLDTFLNGSDGSGGFTSGPVFLPNVFNSNWNAWRGWSISSMRDTLTPGLPNQYSCISGGGYNSNTYAVSYVLGQSTIQMPMPTNDIRQIAGLYINNATYTYLSMLNGDSFAKKFGGATGDDPDFLMLTIKKYKDGLIQDDSVDVFLADYRFTDNSQDYILKDWTYVDLSSLGAVDSLVFSLTSSDTAPWGMNTPAYFCIDNLEYQDFFISTSNLEKETFQIFPNPVMDIVILEGLENGNQNVFIFDIKGRIVYSETLNINDGRTSLDLSFIQSGIYTIRVGEQSTKLIKQ